MRLHRFYVSQPLGEEVVIDDVSLIKQWAKVFRYKEGDCIILFNGDGKDYSYAIHSVSQNMCSLTPGNSSSVYIPTKKSYLYVSVIKKDNFELVVQKATEIGVTDVIPLITERTEKKQLDYRRLKVIVKEASEQSGRGDILTVHEPILFFSIVKNLQKHAVSSSRTFVTTLFGKSLSEIVQGASFLDSSSCAFVIGPEGGWTEAEESFIVSENFTKVSLGKTILRAETAAIVSSFLSVIV